MKFFYIVCVVLISCHDDRTRQVKPEASLDITKIKITTLGNKPIDLAQYKNKVVFINFWATWCKPCVEEMPTIRNAMDSLGDDKIEFLFATDETAEQVQRFEREHNFGFEYVLAANFEELNIMGLPTTFIFDTTGEKVFSEMGFRKWDDAANLDLLLKITNQR